MPRSPHKKRKAGSVPSMLETREGKTPFLCIWPFKKKVTSNGDGNKGNKKSKSGIYAAQPPGTGPRGKCLGADRGQRPCFCPNHNGAFG